MDQLAVVIWNSNSCGKYVILYLLHVLWKNCLVFDLIFFLYQKLAEVKIEVRDREEQVQEKQVIIINYRQWNKFCMKKVIKIFSYGSKAYTRFAEYGANTPQLKLKDPLISKSYCWFVSQVLCFCHYSINFLCCLIVFA